MFRKKRADNKKDTEQIELVVLATVKDSIELHMIKGILDDNGIPYIVKDHGMGGYFRILSGDSGFFQTDVLVDKDAYERAKEIVGQLFFDDNEQHK
ncbi:MAG: DUF2007 domain-containing protein [Caldicoprobacterales bacterium]|nr:DUF2007 domain-containing protein [Clostridiales bacterium]